MNSYIFDWYENCKKIIETGQYTTKKDVLYEQMMLVRYLRDLNVTFDDIYAVWYSTVKDFPIFLYTDEDEIFNYFYKIYKKSDNIRMTGGNKVTIYKQEVDFINNLKCHIWIKEYILVLLCVYKYFGKEWCKYDNKIKSFCYSCTSTKKERERNTMELASVVEKYNIYNVVRASSVFLKVNFCANEGDIFCTINDPREITKLDGAISKMMTCSKCGSVFEYKYTRRNLDLCDECEKKKRSLDRHKNRNRG